MKEELVREWFERANHDLDAARILIKENVYFDVVLFHIHQAVEKYLKGYLLSQGWELRRIHNLDTLLNEAIIYEPSLEEFRLPCQKITEYYVEERYPLVVSSELT